MKERNFKVTETMYDVIKTMTDKTAGKFFKSVCDYAFHGKVYDGNDVTLKSNFLLVKRIIDGQARDREYGRLGAQKLKELRQKQEAEMKMKQAIISCGVVKSIGGMISKLGEKSGK